MPGTGSTCHRGLPPGVAQHEDSVCWQQGSSYPQAACGTVQPPHNIQGGWVRQMRPCNRAGSLVSFGSSAEGTSMSPCPPKPGIGERNQERNPRSEPGGGFPPCPHPLPLCASPELPLGLQLPQASCPSPVTGSLSVCLCISGPWARALGHRWEEGAEVSRSSWE